MRRFTLFSPVLLILVTFLLVYTRFVGIDWGLPFPMHPDERNMVSAILQLRCTSGIWTECLNPHFFAYGQFPLYLAAFMSHALSPLFGSTDFLRHDVVTLSLRAISALASIVMVGFLYLSVKRFHPHLTTIQKISTLLLLTYIPAFIQFAHFGTTESLLMMFVCALTYFGVKVIDKDMSLASYVRTSGILLGLAVGTKVSGAVFAIIPFSVMIIFMFYKKSWKSVANGWFALAKVAAIAVVFFIIASPYNMIDWDGFIHSMNYESSVGLGTYKAFYTRSFEFTVPILFQALSVFPYALGWPVYIVSLLGMIFLPWNRKYLVLRVSAIVLFVPTAFMYAKWTRFIAPVFPILVLFAVLTILSVTKRLPLFIIHHLFIILFALIMIIPGVAYLAIYQNPDVRFVASQWMNEHIEAGAQILSETANVVDVPIESPLHPISFDFYEVDQNPILQSDLEGYTSTAEYIFVPSRRVFWNHTCIKPNNTIHDTYLPAGTARYTSGRCEQLKEEYPVLDTYYNDLFDGSLGFEKVAEFTSFPRICVLRDTCFVLHDESAEETWTVFDHPVVRVYKRRGGRAN